MKQGHHSVIRQRECRIIGGILTDHQRAELRQRHQTWQLRNSSVTHGRLAANENFIRNVLPDIQQHCLRFGGGLPDMRNHMRMPFLAQFHRNRVGKAPDAHTGHRPTRVILRQN